MTDMNNPKPDLPPQAGPREKPLPGDTPGQPTPPPPAPDLPPATPPDPAPRPIPPAAQRALAEAEERRKQATETKLPPEVGGREGPEPVRYGDWEKNGIAVDF